MTAQAESAVAIMEEWRDIAVAPGYQISNLGRVKRSAPARTRLAGSLLKGSPRGKAGYLCVWLQIGGKGRSFSISRLVCTAFHGPAPSRDHQAAHFDGVITTNSAANLRWATPVENADDKRRHGTIRSGDSHPVRMGLQKVLRGDQHWSKHQPERIVSGSKIGTSKINKEIAAAIRVEPRFHGVNVSLAKKYGVSDVLIGRIRRGLQWRQENV